MAQNIPLAITLVVFGSFCFALSASLQHNVVDERLEGNANKEPMTWAKLWHSVRSKRWMSGLGLMGMSLVMQITALTMAPVSVVQPVGLLAFPWSMLMQAFAYRRRIPASMITAVALTVSATLGFTVLSAFHASPVEDLDIKRVLLGSVVLYVCALCFGTLGAHGAHFWRCLFWASGGAIFYGLEAALVKSLIEFTRKYDWVQNPLFWGIVIALVIGSLTAGWMVQQGYATGPAEIVVASMTITSPVVAVLFGIAVLGEGRHLILGVGFAMGLLGILAVVGVITLTHLHRTHYPHTRSKRAEQ